MPQLLFADQCRHGEEQLSFRGISGTDSEYGLRAGFQIEARRFNLKRIGMAVRSSAGDQSGPALAF
jgi:hypothetical protein